MPARNSIKIYIENGYYHIYNRGVEKRLIFLDQQDYLVFLKYLSDYLLPKDEKSLRTQLSNPTLSFKEKGRILRLLRLNNFADEITFLAFCLMPNHFHFFIKQKSSNSIDKFMQSLSTRYIMYFNRRYKRVGTLFQAVYKAASVVHEAQFLYLTKYIHKQGLASKGETLEPIQPSSYKDYIGEAKIPWVKPDEVLFYFSKTNPKLSYKSFVEEKDDFEIISSLTIDD